MIYDLVKLYEMHIIQNDYKNFRDRWIILNKSEYKCYIDIIFYRKHKKV